jgi:hypothetical protein
MARCLVCGGADSFTEGAEGPHSEFVLDFAEDVSGLGCSVCVSLLLLVVVVVVVAVVVLLLLLCLRDRLHC